MTLVSRRLACLIMLSQLCLSPLPAYAKGPETLADLSAQVSDAVVNISATQSADNAAKHGKHEGQNVPPNMGQPGAPFDDLLEEFFRRRGGGQGMPDMQIGRAHV